MNDAEAAGVFVGEILAELTEDLGIEEVGADDVLGDLGLESISLVYLIAEVQQRFRLGDRLLDSLRWHPPTDVRALTVAEFVARVDLVLAEGGAPGPSDDAASVATGSRS